MKACQAVSALFFSLLTLILGAGCGSEEPARGLAGEGEPAPASPPIEARTSPAKVLARLQAQARKDKALVGKVDTLFDRKALEGCLEGSIAAYEKICTAAGGSGEQARDKVLMAVNRQFLDGVVRTAQAAPQGDLMRDFTRIRENGLKLLQYVLRLNAIRLQALLDALDGKKVDRSRLEELAVRLAGENAKVDLEDDHRDRILEMARLDPARMVEEQGCRVQEHADLFTDRRTGMTGPGAGFLIDILRQDMEGFHNLANDMRVAVKVTGGLSGLDRKALGVLFRVHRDWSVDLADRFRRIMKEAEEQQKFKGDKGKLAARAWTSGGATFLYTWLDRLEGLCRGLAPLLDESLSP